MEQVEGILGDLIKELRDITRDNAEDGVTEGLWSLNEWISYLNEAEREVCRRALVLPATLTLTLVAATATYSISSKIIDIAEKGYLNYDESFPVKVTREWLDHNIAAWRTTTGTPNKYYADIYNSTVTVYPIPTSDLATYTIIIDAKALPITNLSMSSTTPSISSRYYEDMKLWALYRAYSKKDAETNDEKLADKYFQMFEISTGPRSNANVERIMHQEPGDLRIILRR